MVANERKRIITSYTRLSEELQELFQQTYPNGYMNAVIPITKPNGETFYAVRLETDDTSYLVKVEVNIDSGDDDEEDDTDYTEPDDDILDDTADFDAAESQEPDF